jgi:sulfite exporter TauE/SafE
MNIEILPLIAVALIGSFSHCISMCGGFVFSYSSVKINSSWSMTYKSLMHLLYGLGRTTSYIFLGAIFGFIGKVLFISSVYKGGIFIALGIFMLILGIVLVNGMGNFKLNFLNADILNTSFMKQLHFKTFKSQTASSFFVFGLLNGLIPCGLVYFFLATAISVGSVWGGMVYMGIFGLCTIPALFLLAISSNFMGVKYKKLFNYISSFILMAYGLFTIFKGALILMGKMGQMGHMTPMMG